MRKELTITKPIWSGTLSIDRQSNLGRSVNQPNDDPPDTFGERVQPPVIPYEPVVHPPTHARKKPSLRNVLLVCSFVFAAGAGVVNLIVLCVGISTRERWKDQVEWSAQATIS